ncbi:putative acyl-CoA thioester hydrolase [Pseudovibrio axinellae]|uniref:Putative acyl-CoA thioester hydrolase n=1 Tax=Pseudovibrio axinellae TaxID=989403 RepID=A0A165T6C7_9HYPH|nr:acyl-CoA thioesterase [Pseudovibrio axinellae]KZL05497.1 putative acyl-CoA thioester hydrolase [Pseudovibrio axinellae]SEP96691.1 acyl-CoA thioesterase YciA [Pseudovibrio axinellae]
MTDINDAGDVDEAVGELTTRTMAMPADTNASGDIFGGWVVSQMDIAAGIAASQCTMERVVTVAIDSMTFIRPVKVGDVMCVYTRVLRIGRTSVTLAIEAWALRHRFGVREKVTNAQFTFVAVDDNGKPVEISEEQRAKYENT